MGASRPLAFVFLHIAGNNGRPFFVIVKAMRVLVATPLYSPDIGGPATYSALLEKEFPARGISVAVVSFSAVRRLPKGLSHLVYFFQLLRASFSAGIIFAQDPVSVGLPAALVAGITRRRFLLKVVGDYAWEQYQQRHSVEAKVQDDVSNFKTPEQFQTERFDLLTEIRRKIERFVARRAEKVIVPSRYLAGIVRMWGVPENRLKVIYNAFTPHASEERAARAGSRETRRVFSSLNAVIGSAGRLVPWKGFPALIRVMVDLKKVLPEAKLLIVGEGPDGDRLKRFARELGVGDSVRFMGVLPHEKLTEFFLGIDIFVLNSAYEGFSHLLLEAMNAGVPVVTTAAGGNAELVIHERNGLIVPWNDQKEIMRSIVRLVRDPECRDLLRERAKETVRDFSPARMIEELAALLKVPA